MAKIKKVTFNKKGVPDKVTLEITVREAALIARMVGEVPSTEIVEKYGDKALIDSGSIWVKLSGWLFNTYWENGLQGYLNGDKA